MNNSDLDDSDVRARGNGRLQRWVDLLAALLSRTGIATFEEFAVDIPDYNDKLREAERAHDPEAKERVLASLKRAFERDKSDLRALGIPIESLEDDDGNEGGAYRLRRRDFYLPYLALTVDGVRTAPKKVDRYGYRELTTLAFDADELQAIVDAALMLRSLGEPLLNAHADSALRKLAFDLPVDAVEASAADPVVLRSRAQEDLAVFDALSDALYRRKRVTFDYLNFSRGGNEQREVEPYGIFFLHGNWYLAGNDRDRADVRNFRLSRISNVSARKTATPEFDIPAVFHLRDHASSRHAWELGDEEPVQVTVRFKGASGPAIAASKLGAEVRGDAALRLFSVRRMDTFVRWILSFAGEVLPVSPGEVVDSYRGVLEGLRNMYERPVDAEAVPSPAARVEKRNVPLTWQPAGAAAQFRRLLHVIPQIADGNEHQLSQLADSTGIEVDVLRRDLYSLVLRYDQPGGFVEGVQLMIGSDSVSAVSNHLRRPMRLTTPELRALELGLAVLRNHRTPNEQSAINRARERVRQLLARLPDDPIADGAHSAMLAADVDSDVLAQLRRAITEKRQVRLAYRKSGSAVVDERVVCPYALVASSGMWYILSHCTREDELRVFRLDRIEKVEPIDVSFEVPSDFSLERALDANRALMPGEYQTMTVRYSPRIARWIAEREGVSLAEDGSLVLEHPVADEAWAVRHVLQYGVEAEVVAPQHLRQSLLQLSMPDNR